MDIHLESEVNEMRWDGSVCLSAVSRESVEKGLKMMKKEETEESVGKGRKGTKSMRKWETRRKRVKRY